MTDLVAIDRLSQTHLVVIVTALPGTGRTHLARALLELHRTRAARGHRVSRYLSLASSQDRAALAHIEHVFKQPDPAAGGPSDAPLLVIDDADWAALLPLVSRIPSEFPPEVRIVCFVSASPARALKFAERRLEEVAAAGGRMPLALYRQTGLPAVDIMAQQPEQWTSVWLRGLLAKSYLAPTDQASYAFRQRTLSELCIRHEPGVPAAPAPRTAEQRHARRLDLLEERRLLGDQDALLNEYPELQQFYQPRSKGSDVLLRFSSILAAAAGDPVNYAAFGRACGVSNHTAESYTTLLEGGLLIMRQPAHVPRKPAGGKRLVRRPRLLFTDSGLLHAALGLRSLSKLLGHARAAHSWRNFVVALLLQRFGLTAGEMPFWSTHTGAWVDAIWWRAEGAAAAVATLEARPRLTKAITVACTDLALQRLWLICPGNRSYQLDQRVHVVAMRDIATPVEPDPLEIHAPLRHT
ncbi:MAG: DUF4143 domain-containing protein [Spirochaetaceae bacterium]|nr:MAG: DUF4143 domain-containing protein [Spirochaetaceae bacterium]